MSEFEPNNLEFPGEPQDEAALAIAAVSDMRTALVCLRDAALAGELPHWQTELRNDGIVVLTHQNPDSKRFKRPAIERQIDLPDPPATFTLRSFYRFRIVGGYTEHRDIFTGISTGIVEHESSKQEYIRPIRESNYIPGPKEEFFPKPILKEAEIQRLIAVVNTDHIPLPDFSSKMRHPLARLKRLIS
jgi:hypothetical protein